MKMSEVEIAAKMACPIAFPDDVAFIVNAVEKHDKLVVAIQKITMMCVEATKGIDDPEIGFCLAWLAKHATLWIASIM